MKINVKHIATLANLPLTTKEEEMFGKQLTAILEHIEKLSQVSTDSIKETTQVTGLTNIERTDIQHISLTQEAAVAQAKKMHNNLFAVPVILEEAVEK